MIKPIEEQTHYEILEVSRNATPNEIQRAYEHARETFHSDSVAIYSLFSEEELRKVRTAIEEAYPALLEEALRQSRESPNIQPPETQRWEKPAELSGGGIDGGEFREAKQMRTKPSSPADDACVETAEYRGNTLKQIRERMGIRLQTISTDTKISVKILEAIEEEACERLPTLVYLKGFLRSYAQSLGLNPAVVIEGYLKALKDKKG